MMNDVRLTQLSKAAGCAAKIGPDMLSEVLGKLPKFQDEKLLVGFETSDDAAVYQVTEDIALIQTLDFFPPVVDDPYTFGQIAAANALSDVYAMGGVPKIALNIVVFPNCLDMSILERILAGGADKVKEAGAILVGGHSVQDDVPKYGLCVSGFVHPKKIYKNFGCKPGDVLILTKQIGSGIINTAVKAELASDSSTREVISVMSTLNKYAKEVLEDYPVHACTDITGFGFLGHCAEMAEASQVSFDLNVRDIAFMNEAVSYAQMGLVPVGAYRNRSFVQSKVEAKGIEECYTDLLYDPQTSGGLLFSIEPRYAEAVVEALEKKPVNTKVSIAGTVTQRREKLIYLH